MFKIDFISINFWLGGKPDLSNFEISNITSGRYGAILGH